MTRPVGKIGIPCLYVVDDPSATAAAQRGALNVQLGLGLGRAELHIFFVGQKPVTLLDEASSGCAEFDVDAPGKFLIDPRRQMPRAT